MTDQIVSLEMSIEEVAYRLIKNAGAFVPPVSNSRKHGDTTPMRVIAMLTKPVQDPDNFGELVRFRTFFEGESTFTKVTVYSFILSTHDCCYSLYSDYHIC